MTSAKSSPEKLGAAAKATGTTVPKLANIAKQCAGLTTDNVVQQEQLSVVQQEQLSAAKTLTDCLLELLNAAKNGNILYKIVKFIYLFIYVFLFSFQKCLFL